MFLRDLKEQVLKPDPTDPTKKTLKDDMKLSSQVRGEVTVKSLLEQACHVGKPEWRNASEDTWLACLNEKDPEKQAVLAGLFMKVGYQKSTWGDVDLVALAHFFVRFNYKNCFLPRLVDIIKDDKDGLRFLRNEYTDAHRLATPKFNRLTVAEWVHAKAVRDFSRTTSSTIRKQARWNCHHRCRRLQFPYHRQYHGGLLSSTGRRQTAHTSTSSPWRDCTLLR